MSDLPDPLVSAEVDLRDFGFMPLDVRTLLTSSLWIKAKKDPRVAHAAMSLWCESWHQVPCASLPDDDEVLADLARCDEKEWKRVRERALAHFVKCSDGRLYHRHVAKKAVESWEAKQAQRARTKAATEAREKKKREAEAALDAHRDEQRDEQRDVPRNDERHEQRDVNRDVHQGTVKGQGRDREERNMVAATASTAPPPAPPLKAKDLEAEGVERQAAADWLQLRKAKRLPLTPTAWADTKAEGTKAGLTPPQTVATAVANNWAGFKASWLQRDAAGKTQSPNGASVFDGAH